jgi:hypothetical protein
MKTVLSFDVGMKNLAYCLFQIGGGTDNNANDLVNYKVLQWEVINLCTPIVKRCNIDGCTEVAKYCKSFKSDDGVDDGGVDGGVDDGGVDGGVDDGGVDGGVDGADDNENKNVIIDYYCSKHARKCKFKIPPSELDMKKIKKKKLVEIQSIIDKYNISSILIKSHESHTPHTFIESIELATASTPTQSSAPKRQKNTKEQMLDMIRHELDKKYLENIENVRADQIDLLTLGKNMMTELDKFVIPYPDINTGEAGDTVDLGNMGGLGKYKIDIVIIENQISTIASRMKTLQGMIAQYFIMRGTPCIEFISAANKLKMFMTKKKTTYTERKIESVEVTKELLEKLPQFEKYRGCLEKNKKKDDLADCFLQGIYYLTLKNMIIIE